MGNRFWEKNLAGNIQRRTFFKAGEAWKKIEKATWKIQKDLRKIFQIKKQKWYILI